MVIPPGHNPAVYRDGYAMKGPVAMAQYFVSGGTYGITIAPQLTRRYHSACQPEQPKPLPPEEKCKLGKIRRFLYCAPGFASAYNRFKLA